MAEIRPFRIDVPEARLQQIWQRVAEFPWHEMPDDGGWDYGTNLDYMKEFCAYWVDHYNWRKHEAELNRFNQFHAEVDAIDLHYIHEPGSGPAPMPLLISHGWPGSVVEFMEIIDPLAHPERFGGSVDDAFEVIAPSLPGFAFSGRSARPYGPRSYVERVYNIQQWSEMPQGGHFAALEQPQLLVEDLRRFARGLR